MTSDVLIVGGGVIGSAVAFYAAREGLRVTLLERETLAGHASGVAAGVLTPIGGHERGPGLGPWAQRCADQFPSLVEELQARSGIDPEYERVGLLINALSAAEVGRLQQSELHRSGAFAWRSRDEVRAAHPQVAETVCGGLWSGDEAHVRSALLTRAYARSAQQLGARIETGVEVLDIDRDGDRVRGVVTGAGRRGAHRVVVCAGPWTPPLGGLREDAVTPARGQILTLGPPSTPLGSMVEGAGVYLVPRRDGTVTVGATEEDAGFDRRATAEGVRSLIERAVRVVPALADSTFESVTSGLRPRTPDGLPIIGPAPDCEGLALATGHYRYGILLSPITGQLVAGWITGKGIPADASLFLPGRFS